MFLKDDKVWSPTYGEGVVESVGSRNQTLICKFTNYRDLVAFTTEGIEDRETATNQTLFHSGSYIMEAPEPPREYFPKPGDTCKIHYRDENIICFWRLVTVLNISDSAITVEFQNGKRYCFDLDKCKFKFGGCKVTLAKDERPATIPTPNNFQWTSAPPTKPGYYWWRITEKESACIKKVYFIHGALHFTHKEHEPLVSSFSAFQWAGPIPEPLEGDDND